MEQSRQELKHRTDNKKSRKFLERSPMIQQANTIYHSILRHNRETVSIIPRVDIYEYMSLSMSTFVVVVSCLCSWNNARVVGLAHGITRISVLVQFLIGSQFARAKENAYLNLKQQAVKPRTPPSTSATSKLRFRPPLPTPSCIPGGHRYHQPEGSQRGRRRVPGRGLCQFPGHAPKAVPHLHHRRR